MESKPTTRLALEIKSKFMIKKVIDGLLGCAKEKLSEDRKFIIIKNS